MKDTYISDSVLYVGVDDKTIDLFESQYVVPNGVSYNSYVIMDDKIAIMDTVDPRKTTEWLANVEQALAGRLPDYLVIHHMEPDHAGSIQQLAEKYPDMKFVSNPKLFAMMEQSMTSTSRAARWSSTRATPWNWVTTPSPSS